MLPTALRVNILQTVCLTTAARPPWLDGLLSGTWDICPSLHPEDSASVLLKAVVLGWCTIVIAHVPNMVSRYIPFLTGVQRSHILGELVLIGKEVVLDLMECIDCAVLSSSSVHTEEVLLLLHGY